MFSNSTRPPYEFDFLLRHDLQVTVFESFSTFWLKSTYHVLVYSPLELVEALLYPLNRITAPFHLLPELGGIRIVGAGLGTIL